MSNMFRKKILFQKILLFLAKSYDQFWKEANLCLCFDIQNTPNGLDLISVFVDFFKLGHQK